jgi:hypothetical protein
MVNHLNMPRIERLEDLLSVETSRRNSDLIADMILQKPALFGELMSVFFRNEEPVSRRAAWVMDIVSEKSPELISPYIEEIARHLPEFTHDGMKRESVKVLARSPMVSEQFGPLMNICFRWLVSPEESVAVKMFSMEILYRMSEIEPDLRHELADSIEWRMQEETPGFKSKGRKLLAKLNRGINRG